MSEPKGKRPAQVTVAGIVINDPFGILGGLDLSLLGNDWKTPAHAAAALAASGMADDAIIAPPGVRGGAEPGRDKRAARRDGPSEPGEPGEPGERSERDVCAQCGGPMHRGASNLEYVCADCGLIIEGDTAEPEDDDAPRAAPNAARLRIVGPNSNQLQPDLYRSGSGNTAVTQKKQIFEEYKAYRSLFIEAGSRAFPLNACELAADYYNAVQQKYVKRSQNKKAIMAACLWRACLQVDFAPSKADVAAFMQLQTKGIARGDNFIRGLVADGNMDLEINADPSRPEITTLFALLGYEGARFADLQDAVYEIVQTAIRNNIGTNSILRSKVAGATYAVLRRCKNRELIPRPMSMQEFCAKRIRKNTVERFLREVDDYHSYFKEIYEKAGLDATPTRGRR
jgi:transcription initiation factor TFIIIB Brf1 subunit/transcription initiation factor TFIIB